MPNLLLAYADKKFPTKFSALTYSMAWLPSHVQVKNSHAEHSDGQQETIPTSFVPDPLEVCFDSQAIYGPTRCDFELTTQNNLCK